MIKIGKVDSEISKRHREFILCNRSDAQACTEAMRGLVVGVHQQNLAGAGQRSSTTLGCSDTDHAPW